MCEIYPTKNGKAKYFKIPHVSGTKIEEINQYIQDKYIDLFKADMSIEDIISNVISKLIELTGSKNGYLATLDNQCLNYYCIYMNVGKVVFKSGQMECGGNFNLDCFKMRCIKRRKVIITNDISTDPRRTNVEKFPDNHPNITKFMGIPLLYNGECLGQIGLSNSESKYTLKMVSLISPITTFLANFLYLKNERRLLATRELEIQQKLVVLKDSFIATMSHEIRTPLNGIITAARLLGEYGELSTEQERYIQILSECSIQLLELINDILDYSKMTAHGITLSNEPFNMRRCIQSAIDIVSQRLADKNLELGVNISPELIDSASGDSRRLKQIIINLLTNSIKFTEKGWIKLDVNSQQLSEKSQIMYTFSVTDTGIGIQASDHERIFEIFTKVKDETDSVYSSTTPGIGMGLSISKHIVEAMGGKISVESDGVSGSKFTFNIVLDNDTDFNRMSQQYSEIFQNKIVLVIDDVEDNRIYLSNLLHKWGLTSYSFSSGREALNYMTQNGKFDLVITDICMPNMSGVEVAQIMRKKELTQSIIALSSAGETLPGKECFDHFLTKPVSRNKLFNCLIQLFSKLNTCKRIDVPISKLTKKISRPPGECKILIAEDDHYNQIVIKELLNKLGYSQITIVSNGQLCVEQAETGKFDICFMDIKMPVMNGLDATKIIKNNITDPPVIIAVTASVLEQDKIRCYVAGVDGYLSKPIQKEHLVDTLKLFSTTN